MSSTITIKSVQEFPGVDFGKTTGPAVPSFHFQTSCVCCNTKRILPFSINTHLPDLHIIYIGNLPNNRTELDTPETLQAVFGHCGYVFDSCLLDKKGHSISSNTLLIVELA